MKYFHGEGRSGPYFEGWYFRHQGAEGDFAVIPAFHQKKDGSRMASVQIITPEYSRMFYFPGEAFQAWPDRFLVRVGNSCFSAEGIRLDLADRDFSVTGELRYGPFAPLDGDIMGPFRHVPGMQCVHGVLSMGHQVDGLLCVNGRNLLFRSGMGYVETDRGRSFPKRYLWTQCIWRERQRGSLVLSIAHIPVGPWSFTGCICEVRHAGRSWRLATYRGAVVEQWGENGAVIRQGEVRLEVGLVDKRTQPLQAPAAGEMSRTVHESLCAVVRYRFWDRSRLLFDHTDDRAGYEYADEPV